MLCLWIDYNKTQWTWLRIGRFLELELLKAFCFFFVFFQKSQKVCFCFFQKGQMDRRDNYIHEVFKIQMWLNWFQHHTPYAVMKLTGFDEINFSVSVIRFRNAYITMIYHVSYHWLGFSSISYFINNIFIWVKISIHRIIAYILKRMNLITAPGSVSNEPGSVTWLATKYLKTVSWRNHTEKWTTLWPQNT